VQGAEAAHAVLGKGHVGGLGRGANHDGEIQEVAVIRCLAAGEIQAARYAPHHIGVAVVGIAQGEHGLGKGPGAGNRQASQGQRSMARSALQVFERGQLCPDGTDTGQRRRHHQNQFRQVAFVLLQGALAHALVGAAPHHVQRQQDIQHGQGVPGQQQAAYRMDRCRQQQGDRPTAGHAGKQARAGQQNPQQPGSRVGRMGGHSVGLETVPL